MAKNGFKVMDSDMHVVEPLDLWERYTEPAFRDRAPKGISRARGDMQIELEGHLMPAEPDNLLISKSVEQVDIYKEPEELRLGLGFPGTGHGCWRASTFPSSSPVEDSML